MNPSTADQLAMLLPWLASDDAQTPDIPIDLCESEWLAPLVFVRLGEAGHPDRARLNAAFTQSFTRRALLEKLWREVLGAMAKLSIEVITLGSLPFAETIYQHAGARFSQDIDLLVQPENEARTKAALADLGWVEHPGLRLLEREGVQLDLHTTPGEEARTPILRSLFGQTTGQLFQQATACEAGGLMLGRESLLNNRVIHFFKHACEKPLHGLEIALLLKGEFDLDVLKAEITATKAARLWRFVLEVLKRWGFDFEGLANDLGLSLDCDADAVESAANLKLGFSLYRVIASWMGPIQRMRYGWQIVWPSREELYKTYGVANAGLLMHARLRALRAKKFIGALLS